jgi:hypothetical protein
MRHTRTHRHSTATGHGVRPWRVVRAFGNELAVLCLAACLLAGAASADRTREDSTSDLGASISPIASPIASNPHIPAHLTGRFLHLPLQQAGGTSGGMLQVFKLGLRHLLPEHRRGWSDFLRPFLLAGKTDLQVPGGHHYGVDIPGGERVTALHIGGGADLLLGDRWRMSAHIGEMINSGNTQQANDSRYRVSVGYDF